MLEYTMTYKIYLDDLRAPPDSSWMVARTVDAAKHLISEYGVPNEMSLDHDLGTGIDAPELLKWIATEFMDGRMPRSILTTKVTVHSANIPGILNLRGYWCSFVESQTPQS